MFFIGAAKFASFAQAAECAFTHALQRGECLVRFADGTLAADFRPNSDGSVSIMATDRGRAFVEEAAR